MVTVTDGHLTVSNGAGASNNKVNYLDIDRPGRVGIQRPGWR